MMLPAIPKAAYPALYNNMRKAIAKCHAMEAYYNQIADDESARQFRLIKLRSYWRLGQLVLDGVNFSGCQTRSDYGKRIRDHWKGNPLIEGMRRLGSVKEAAFDAHEVAADGSIERMLFLGYSETEIERAAREDLLAREERAQAKEKKREQQWAAHARAQEEKKAAAERLRIAQQERETIKKNRDRIKLLHDEVREEVEREIKNEMREQERKRVRASDIEPGEVGLTLKQKHRRRLKTFPILLNAAAHEQLRKAAFDRKRTMWSIAREGLDLWFVANGYPAIAYTDGDDDAEAAA
jgi:hypothetical protein